MDTNNLPAKNCSMGECYKMSGLYNCTEDYCKRVDEVLNCDYFREFRGKTHPNYHKGHRKYCLRDDGKCYENVKVKQGRHDKTVQRDKSLNGFFHCDEGTCNEIHRSLSVEENCFRKCTTLEVRNKNLIVFNQDRLYMSMCSKSSETYASSLTWGVGRQALMVFCSNVTIPTVNGSTTNDVTNIKLEDCFNATMIQSSQVSNLLDYRYLMEKYLERSNDVANVEGPTEQSLVLETGSKLVAYDVEDCNCREFHEDFGSDGSLLRANSRFRCRSLPGHAFAEDFVHRNVSCHPDLGAWSSHLLAWCALPGVIFVVSLAYACYTGIGGMAARWR